MFIRKYWLLLSVFVVAIVGVGLYMLATQSPPETVKIYKAVKPIEKPTQQPTAEAPVGDTSQGGHWHGDEWHPDPHETHDPPAVSVGQSYIPEGADVTPNFPPVDPSADPVEEAYKRLEYIKNNPYAWGGVHSERATELIAQLLPPPVLMDEDHGHEVEVLILELIATNDPRAGEVLITTMCEGNMLSVMMDDGLDAIGPPAVPYILPYVRENFAMASVAIKSLGRIAELYRDDLGGIVDHIIIPKLEVIAADEDAEYYKGFSVLSAREALSRLGR